MQRILILLSLIFTSCVSQRGNIQVTVQDAQTLTPLPGANVKIEDLSIQKRTEKDGQCSIESLETGTYTLRVSFIGYYTIRFANVSVVRNALTKLVAELEMETGMRGIETIDARKVQVIEKRSN